MNRIKNTLKTAYGKIKSRPKTSAFVAILVFIIAGSIARGSAVKVESITVNRGTIIQEVAVTGKTISVHDVDLGFDKGGRVLSAPVSVGDRVVTGEVLATLESGELSANVAKARADLNEAKVKLNQAKSQSVESYADSRANMVASIKDSYTKSDDALRNVIDKFFKNARQSSNYIEFTFKDENSIYTFPIDNDLRLQINSERYKLESILKSWQNSISNLNANSDLSKFSAEAETNLNLVNTFLDKVAFAVNTLEPSEFKYESTISGYKTDVSGARDEVTTALSSLIAAKEKLTAAPRLLPSDSGSAFDSVLAEEAKVAQYEAALQSAEAKLGANVIRSPIEGIVTKQDAKVGEIVVAGDKLVSVISDADMEIEANVSEVNIGKVKLGNEVSITFDAFPGKSYSGKVFYIEPAETIVDNVVNYKIKVSIDKKDVQEMKSGLTANLKIKTAIKEGVLKVPQYAVSEVDGKTVIKILDGKKEKNREITVGLVGNDGNVEIISGLSDGEKFEIKLLK